MTVRSRLAEDASADYEKLKSTLWEAMESVKKAWLSCPHCKKRSEVEVPDSSSRVRAVELALEQGFGRPPQERAGEAPRPSSVTDIYDMSMAELEAVIAYEESKMTPEELKAEAERREAFVKKHLAGLPGDTEEAAANRLKAHVHPEDGAGTAATTAPR